MTPHALRAYQSRGIEAARAARRAGHRRILLSLPTGGGKTVMAVAMIASALGFSRRVLVIAHRKELIDQFWSQLHRAGITAGVMRAQDERTDAALPVQVGTIQTLSRRDLPPADLVFVDEAHRVPGDSYQRVIDAYPKATIFGLTATPCRLDGKPLREFFDVLIQVASYSELIEEGSILAPVVYRAKIVPNLAKVRKLGGDYNEHDLEAAMMGVHVVGNVVRNWLEKARLPDHSGYLPTVLFAVGIDHSKGLIEKFRAEGVRCAHLDGTTPEDERERILLDLELGKLDLVSNVGVLTEGWDQPRVKCCVMARPTLSLTLWMQCAGRILRPWCQACGGKCSSVGTEGHGYTAPLVLDHSGNVDRHGLPHEDREWSLDGEAKRKSAQKYRMCPGCYAYVEASPCPLCGYVADAKERKVKVADGVLEKIDAGIKRDRGKPESSDPKRAYFDKMVEQARSKGFKPGYAAAKYKEKFDDQWPPWAWSQSVKADYAKDEHWQARVEKRAREREFWQDRQKAAEQTAQDAQTYAEPEAEPGIGDW